MKLFQRPHPGANHFSLHCCHKPIKSKTMDCSQLRGHGRYGHFTEDQTESIFDWPSAVTARLLLLLRILFALGRARVLSDDEWHRSCCIRESAFTFCHQSAVLTPRLFSFGQMLTGSKVHTSKRTGESSILIRIRRGHASCEFTGGPSRRVARFCAALEYSITEMQFRPNTT
jgi:hypothetical protein